MEQLSGIVAILPTPMMPLPDGSGGPVDEDGLAHLVRYCVDQGLDGVVVLGSNGEFPYLSFEEKRRVMQVAVEAAEGRVPVIGTASADGTAEAVELALAATEAGCDAVMAALRRYFALDPAEVVAHYRTLAEQGGLPVVLYHFPEVTGLDMAMPTIREIAEIDGVVAAKLTVVNLPWLTEAISAVVGTGMSVFTGTCFLLAECLSAGGAGAFCPLPLLRPAAVREVADAVATGDGARTEEAQRVLLGAIPATSGIDLPVELLIQGFQSAALGPYGGPGAPPAPGQGLLKEALRLQGHPISSAVRSPCPQVTPDQSALVERTLRDLGWLG